MTKICNRCGKEYPLTEEYFYKHKQMKDGFLGQCKTCRKELDKEYREKNHEVTLEKTRKYKEANREEINARNRLKYAENNEEERRKNREYRNANKDKVNAWKREYRKRFPEKHKEKDKKWRESEKGAAYIEAYKKSYRNRRTIIHRSYNKNRRASDVYYKLITNIRTRINIAVKRGYKSGTAVDLIGCSIEELKIHIESQFKDGMTWDNWSPSGWHIDHIVPCSSFDLTKDDEQKKCFHWSNLQPLWAVENLKKHAKILT